MRWVIIATLFLANALAQPQGEGGTLTTTAGQEFPGQLLEPIVTLETALAVGGVLNLEPRFIRRLENTDGIDTVVLRDDARLTGAIVNAALQFTTRFGTRAIDLTLIRTVELSGAVPRELTAMPEARRQVRLTDGQVLVGRISASAGDVVIQLSFATVRLRPLALRSLQVMADRLTIEATDGARFSGSGAAPDLSLEAPYGTFLIPGQLIQVVDVVPSS
ncbi:MAG: hypothetical protein HY335_02105 [Deinococcus sp.]|nr:hypothetical protein [Deinococcus sp.]